MPRHARIYRGLLVQGVIPPRMVRLFINKRKSWYIPPCFKRPTMILFRISRKNHLEPPYFRWITVSRCLSPGLVGNRCVASRAASCPYSHQTKSKFTCNMRLTSRSHQRFTPSYWGYEVWGCVKSKVKSLWGLIHISREFFSRAVQEGGETRRLLIINCHCNWREKFVGWKRLKVTDTLKFLLIRLFSCLWWVLAGKRTDALGNELVKWRKKLGQVVPCFPYFLTPFLFSCTDHPPWIECELTRTQYTSIISVCTN